MKRKPPKNYEGAFTQLPNRPGKYPGSVVVYTKFESPGVQKVFNYLQEKEKIYQQVVREANGHLEKTFARKSLEEVEGMLIFISHNLPEWVDHG